MNSTSGLESYSFNPTQISHLCHWINVRESIRLKKEHGFSKPWTDDPILREYRFCNVRREDDRVTRWIRKNIREFYPDSTVLWFNLIVARIFNNEDTLEEIGWIYNFDRQEFFYLKECLHRRAKAGLKNFNSAYIISTNGAAMNKIDYVTQYVLVDAWKQAEVVGPPYKTCQGAHELLTKINGIGSFLGAQVVADMKYTPILKDAPDWWDWCAPGPGSQRGLNRLTENPLKKKWRQNNFIVALQALRSVISEFIEHEHLVPLHLQDLQNCLCEFDKYMRAINGEGTPKQRYAGS